jgi:hypothetical protein
MALQIRIRIALHCAVEKRPFAAILLRAPDNEFWGIPHEQV